MASLFDVWCQSFNYASCSGIRADDFSFWGTTASAVVLLVGAVYAVAVKHLA